MREDHLSIVAGIGRRTKIDKEKGSIIIEGYFGDLWGNLTFGRIIHPKSY